VLLTHPYNSIPLFYRFVLLLPTLRRSIHVLIRRALFPLSISSIHYPGLWSRALPSSPRSA
jgi:hypothetical protein